MNVIICDDEPLYISAVANKVTEWAQHTGRTRALVLQSYTSSEDLLEDWEHGLVIDLLFMDIQIPGEMSGMAVAKAIHQRDEYIPIIFITNYAEYACEGYEVNALRFLRKPITTDAIFECMDIVWKRWQYLCVDTVTIESESGSQVLRLPAASIVYIEAIGHSLVIHVTGHTEQHVIRGKLDAIRKLLPSTHFCQCHRSYIINLMYVRKFYGNLISLADENTIPIGRLYHRDFVDQFRSFYLGE